MIPQHPTPNKDTHIAASGLNEFLCDVDLYLRGCERRRTGLTMTLPLQGRSRREMEGTITEPAVRSEPVYRDCSPLSKTHHDSTSGRGNCGWEKEWTGSVTGCVSVLRGRLRGTAALRQNTSLGSKELLKEFTALPFEQASRHLYSMIEPAFGRNIKNRSASTGFGIPRSEYKPRNAGLHNRSGTHGARLQRDIKRRLG